MDGECPGCVHLAKVCEDQRKEIERLNEDVKRLTWRKRESD